MKPKSRSRNSRQTGSLANRRFGLDHLYQSAPVGLCLMDRDLRYVRINEQLAAINGKSVAEHIGRTLREVIPEIAQQVEPMYRGVLDTGRPVLNVEVRGMTPAEPGVEKYWLTSYFPVKANGGAVEGVNTVVQDITDRKRAQEALRASEERLRLLVESTDVIPWEADAQTWRFTYVGPQAVKILGYPLDQWYEGDFWVAHIHPEDREYAVAFCVESSKQARDYEFEYRMLSADGKTIWLHDLVSVESVGGVPKKLRGFMIDITGRKQTEQALRESEARYRAVVEGSLQGMYVHRDGIIEFANDTLARMLGYASTRELTGQHYRVLLAPHERARLEGYRVARLQGEAAPPRYEFQGLRKDGTPVSLECLASLVSWDREPAILTTFLDITDRKRAQQALEERLHFENLLSTVCREFVSRPASEAAGAMEWALESVSAFLQADRSAVLEFTEDKTKLRVTHYWCSDGMTPRFSVNDVVPVDYLPWLKDKLLQGEVVYASRIDDLPDEAGAYKLYCQRAGMRSVLNIPLVADGSTLGNVVLVSERSELTWPEDIIQRARLVGEIFANVLTRKRADEALRKSEAALQNRERDLRILAGKLLSAQEEERRRVARELHDDLTQQLALLAIETGKLEQQLSSSRKLVRDRLRGMKDEIVRLSAEVHRISRQLHPSILDDLGLVAAIESECGRFSAREEIAVEFTQENVPEGLPKDVALCLYRITQEGLRNIAKHAQTRKAQVTLAGIDGILRLSIRDWGVGCDLARVQRKGGLGLASMEERIRLLQGHLAVRSEPGQGTTIEVWTPDDGIHLSSLD